MREPDYAVLMMLWVLEEYSVQNYNNQDNIPCKKYDNDQDNVAKSYSFYSKCIEILFKILMNISFHIWIAEDIQHICRLHIATWFCNTLKIELIYFNITLLVAGHCFVKVSDGFVSFTGDRNNCLDITNTEIWFIGTILAW